MASQPGGHATAGTASEGAHVVALTTRTILEGQSGTNSSSTTKASSKSLQVVSLGVWRPRVRYALASAQRTRSGTEEPRSPSPKESPRLGTLTSAVGPVMRAEELPPSLAFLTCLSRHAKAHGCDPMWVACCRRAPPFMRGQPSGGKLGHRPELIRDGSSGLQQMPPAPPRRLGFNASDMRFAVWPSRGLNCPS